MLRRVVSQKPTDVSGVFAAPISDNWILTKKLIRVASNSVTIRTRYANIPNTSVHHYHNNNLFSVRPLNSWTSQIWEKQSEGNAKLIMSHKTGIIKCRWHAVPHKTSTQCITICTQIPGIEYIKYVVPSPWLPRRTRDQMSHIRERHS